MPRSTRYNTIQEYWLNSNIAYKEGRELDYVLWEITHKCNLECIHCRSASSPSLEERELISGEYIDQLLEELVSLGRPTLVLTGGEPLTRKDFMEIVDKIEKYNIPFRVQTNGLLLTDKIAKKLADASVLNVGIGLDGPEEIHDVIRNKRGAFKRAIKAIKILNKYEIPVHIEFTIMKLNLHYIRHTLDILDREVKIDTFLARSVIFSGRATPFYDYFLLTPNEYRQALYVLYNESKKRSFMVQSQDPLYFKINPDLIKIYKKYGDIFSGNILSGCSACLNMLNIRPDGSVGICSFIPYTIGNIKTQSLAEIWRNRLKYNFCRKLYNRELHGKCSRCPFKYICGGCRARALAITGDLFGEDPYCW